MSLLLQNHNQTTNPYTSLATQAMENYPNPMAFYVPSPTPSLAPPPLDTMSYRSSGREHHGDTNKLFGQTRSESEETKLGSTKSTKVGKKVKKPRYAFQTRSQVDILDDGYRWRKYGQKAVKNNKFPRSYYRCTHQGCDVKKQVQRLTKDEEVVVTTYEGMHSHLIEKSTDNFEHILTQMQIYGP